MLEKRLLSNIKIEINKAFSEYQSIFNFKLKMPLFIF